MGVIDLRSYDVPDEVKRDMDIGACWATWSVPFDREANGKLAISGALQLYLDFINMFLFLLRIFGRRR